MRALLKKQQYVLSAWQANLSWLNITTRFSSNSQMIQGRVSSTSKTRNLRRFSSVHFWMPRKFTVSKFKWLFWIYKSFKRLWIYESHIFEVRLNWELGTNSDQLPVGLLAQLVERFTGITKIMGSNPVQAWNFFRPAFHYCLSSVHYCEDRFHIAKVC